VVTPPSPVEQEIIDGLAGAKGQFLSSSEIAKQTASGYAADYIRRHFEGLRVRGLIVQGKSGLHRIAG
jgi:hypothetical protein